MDNSTSTPTETSTTTSVHHASPAAAFIIGLIIIILASVLNAAGLNLTKLDHVRTNAIPKSARRRDWLRPLWLSGMTLYIMSQLIGSTLALDYMRAGESSTPSNTLILILAPHPEYVAPLGSTSLIFNFLFARFLVGTPVTQTDIYGTIIVIVGVIGIVAFGGINSGLSSETNVDHLTALWRRGGWLAFFFTMSIALILVLKFTFSLDAVLASRSDITSEPFAGMGTRRSPSPSTTFVGRVQNTYASISLWIMEKLELWTASKDDRQIAWILGIGWACCGGGLAGGCLVFAKATVKLLTGSLSHENPGNQFGHIAPIFTIIFLSITAVLQIICLNRGLKVYDSTLVVPVFYGVYTASGFLDSLIFNNEVDAYKPWILFLIFASIVILISGVVLLTHKKPERSQGNVALSRASGARSAMKDSKDGEEDEVEALRVPEEGESAAHEQWQLGDMSDDEDDVDSDTIRKPVSREAESDVEGREEGRKLIEEEALHRRSTSSDATLHARRDEDEFGEWNEGAKDYGI